VTSADDYPYDARRRIEALIETLRRLTDRDPEQEVQGIAVPVLDAVIESVRDDLDGDPVMAKVRSVISVEQIHSGEPIRAADALLVAEQIDAAIGPNLFGFA
jgi:hypothetical protein